MIVKSVNKIDGDVTLLHLVEILRGSKNAKIIKEGHEKLEIHGKLHSFKRSDIERILRKLICDSFLVEDVKVNAYTETVACYIKIGKMGNRLLYSGQRQQIDFPFINETIKKTKNKLDYLDNLSDSEDEDGKSLKPKRAVNPRKELVRLCKAELLEKVKALCKERKHKGWSTIFNAIMIEEMLKELPTNQPDLLKITGICTM